MSQFQATLVLDSHMRTRLMQAYREANHTLNHSDSEIKFLKIHPLHFC